MQVRVRLAATVVAAVISALSLAAAAPTPASAASASGVTYRNSSVCVTASAGVNPYNSDSAGNDVYAYADPYHGDCSTPQVLPSVETASMAEVYKWTTGSSWAYCASTRWSYVWSESGSSAGVSAPLAGTCGAGWYGVWGAGFIGLYPTGGGYQWYGGWAWSGDEYYPVTITHPYTNDSKNLGTAHRVALTPSEQSQAAAPTSGAGGARHDKLAAETPVVNHAGQLVRDTHGNLEMHRTDVKPPVQSAR